VRGNSVQKDAAIRPKMMATRHFRLMLREWEKGALQD
jgi:hypothetical protein